MKIKFALAFLTVLTLTACQNKGGASFSSNSTNPSSEEINISSSENPSSKTDYSSKEQSSSSRDDKSSEEEHSSSQIIDIDHYNGYYASLKSWKDGEDLKRQLYTIMRDGYTPLSYVKSSGANYESNINADHSQYDYEYLDVVYSENHVFKTETNRGWQREHAFCASLMCGSLTSDAVRYKGRATDFHNLFASNASANSSRGNKNYGYADKNSETYTNRTTQDGLDGYSFDPINFEPGDHDKGRLSRAIFYMATMYQEDELDTVNNVLMKGLTVVEDPVSYTAGNYEAYAIGNLSTLLEWNDNFAVDYLEMQHNISVYQDVLSMDEVAQGNRNPYIDYPELVDYAFGDKKDSAGQLSDLTPSASYLKMEEETFSHYAIKEAKREYTYDEQIQDGDYVLLSVSTDYTAVELTAGYTHSLNNHIFSESDGDYIDATITTNANNLSYRIVLNPMANCSTGIIVLNKDGIDEKKPNEEQSIKCGSYDFYFSFTTTYANVATDGMTLRNDAQNGGFYLGSGTKNLTSLTLKSQDSYTVDRVYIKSCTNNKSSTYTLTIKVGDIVLLNNATVDNNNTVYKLYGAKSNTPLTGQISFIFTGTNALRLNSIAFNEIML